MKSSSLRYIFVLSAIVLFLCIGIIANAGTYKDRDGNNHTWKVGVSHSLTWDGAAYIPFGFVYNPLYLSDVQSEENFNADKAAFDALKKAGITDILIRPGKGLSSAPADAFQRISIWNSTPGFNPNADMRICN
jgi:hypothetical protein